ncbi:MAG: Gfo/Idh/MocA family oxidoreductase [Burkholderiales bacterium]
MAERKVRVGMCGLGSFSVVVANESTRLEIFTKGKTDGERVELEIGDPLLEEIDEFAECVRTGRKPETDGYASFKALALIRAAIESARTGRAAEVDRF